MTNQNKWNKFPNVAYISKVYPCTRLGENGNSLTPDEFAQAWGRESALENELEFNGVCVVCHVDATLTVSGVNFCDECKPRECDTCGNSASDSVDGELHLNSDGVLVCFECFNAQADIEEFCPKCGVNDPLNDSHPHLMNCARGEYLASKGY